jgi:hypothetical protein
MKSKKEIYNSFIELLTNLVGSKTAIMAFIESVQNEAYNQALEDAAENAEAIIKIEGKYAESIPYIDKESILKLKK